MNNFRVYKKPEVSMEDIMVIDTKLAVLMAHFFVYCENNNLPCTVTSILSDQVKGRVHSTHSEGRAFDASVKGWSEDQIKKAIAYFNLSFRHIGAISAKTGRPTPIVYHKTKGGAYHFHFQVRPKEWIGSNEKYSYFNN